MQEYNYSVIIPAFNAENTIIPTLEAIASQTTPPLEIIVVDDFSSDKTREKVFKFNQKSQIIARLIELESNSGSAGSPRNRGLEHLDTKAEYIAFCDADDIWLPFKMELQIASMYKNKLNFSFTDVFYVTSSRVTAFECRSIPTTVGEKTIKLEDFKFDNPVKSASTTVIRRDMLAHINFPEGEFYRAVEDYYAWLNLLARDDIQAAKILIASTIYRQIEGSASSSKTRMVTTRKRTYSLKKKIFENAGKNIPSFPITEALYLTKQVFRSICRQF